MDRLSNMGRKLVTNDPECRENDGSDWSLCNWLVQGRTGMNVNQSWIDSFSCPWHTGYTFILHFLSIIFSRNEPRQCLGIGTLLLSWGRVLQLRFLFHRISKIGRKGPGWTFNSYRGCQASPLHNFIPVIESLHIFRIYLELEIYVYLEFIDLSSNRNSFIHWVRK